jgi:excinuclease ABC subunit A
MTPTAPLFYNNGFLTVGQEPEIGMRPSSETTVSVRGAREHNLQGVDVDLPRDALTTVTGVSGSGKSSLAFDTIYREGQRRFLESLSSYARQFLGQMEKPRVDRVEGLSPTVAIDQRGLGRNPRSTVGTVSEVHDFLRLLYARLGCPHCPGCGRPITTQGPDQITETLLRAGADRTAVVLAPIVRDRKGEYRKELEDLRLRGYVRARIDGEIRRLEEVDRLERYKSHSIEILIDRVPLAPEKRSRLAEAVELGLREGRGVVGALLDGEPRFFGTARSCPDCGVTIPELEPRLFSFNSPHGACSTCRGIGRVAPGDPIREGGGESAGPARVPSGEGTPCPDCGGSRLGPVARGVRFRGRTLPETASSSIEEVLREMRAIRLEPAEAAIGRPILRELVHRLEFLRDAGVGYLTLDRPASTLAGGEAQRIRLARQVGSALRGVLYVLDEPSIGLHARDHGRLLGILHRLRDLGNTVLVVEHDAETMLASDHLIDLGPGAGREGGKVVAAGPVREVLRSRRSSTAAYLRGDRAIPAPAARRPPGDAFLRFHGAREHNLKGIDVAFPVGRFTVVTGVSGSGKSTLVDLVIRRAVRRALGGGGPAPGAHDRMTGHEAFDKVVEVDASPIGRTARSNAATYTKVFGEVRSLFALCPEARMRGYTPARFSFNVPGGRCEECGGAGVREIDLQFLANVQVPCDACGGRRFNEETLAIRFKGKSILDLLEMTVDEAVEFLGSFPRARRILETLQGVGLGYLRLGQPSTTLSGGEAQRVKLAAELARPRTGRTLYLLDEPTTGLHFEDVRRLLDAIGRLVEGGNTVIVIEHNLDVIAASDWIVDLGPEGGEAGGRVVAVGTPETVAGIRASRTGTALRAHLARRPGGRPRRGRRAARADGIRIARARTHNLRGLSVRIPDNRMTVLTGVSGAGKSSLAFDTLFAEAQRRFVESMSTYARRFLGRMERADVDRIEGLRPAIAVDEKVPSLNPRSTVATTTEIHDHLRLLFARVGRRHCPACGRELRVHTPSAAARECVERLSGERIEILAPLHLPGSGIPLALDRADHMADLEGELRRSGFLRVRIGEETVRLGEAAAPVPPDARVHLVADRLDIDASSRGRLAESFEHAFEWGHGIAAIGRLDGGVEYLSTMPTCVPCGFVGEREIPPRALSFNSHAGACPACDGLGRVAGRGGAGLRDGGSAGRACPDCGGARLRPEARAIRIGGRSIAEVCSLTVAEAEGFFARLELGSTEERIASRILLEIRSRLEFLRRVGLEYLTLDRRSPTLAGGESQRIRLATQVGNRLVGVLYVLDEPTVGLHPQDAERLLETLLDLRDRGNTLVVVDHDRTFLRRADHVIDLGPGAGSRGGKIVYAGSVEGLASARESLTGAYLSGRRRLPARERRPVCADRVLRVRGARAHNLRRIDVEFPRGLFHAVTGVSGSGKSSLVLDVLLPNLRERLRRGGRPRWRDCDGIDGADGIERVVVVDPRPIGRSPASCPATYSGAMDGIRELFAELPYARRKGFGKDRFSTRVGEGRCEACRGLGSVRIEMHFLSDLWVRCESCGGRRFNEETLHVEYRGRNIADVLDLEVADAMAIFDAFPAISGPLRSLEEVGLGYLTLGQSATTLSSGESQRLKLARELASPGRGETLYLLDEPTTGLHFADIHRLLQVFHRLVDAGHTLIVVEHDPDVIRAADRVVDLGPGGGDAGGGIVAVGTPEEVAGAPDSATGRFLAGGAPRW